MTSWNDQTVLVTGATGFIGSHVAERLIESGATVRGLARKPSRGAWLAERGVEIVQGDLTDAESLKRAVQDCSVVFSIAAWMGRPGSLEDGRRISVDGTRSLIEAAIAAGARRIVHTSSISAYGPVADGIIQETHPLRATDPYGVTKTESEAVVFGYADQIEVSVIRPAQIYGPRGGMWTRGLFKAVKRGSPILVAGGKGTFHACYIENLVDAYMFAATRSEAVGEAFTIVDGVTTWREFVGHYARMAGRPARSLPAWLPKTAMYLMLAVSKITRRRPPATPDMIDFLTGSSRYDTDKAQRLLGWSPRVSIDEGMRSVETWLRDTGRLT